MKVKAAPGVRVPMDGAPRKYITEENEVTVDESPYYLLRVRDRDLIRTDVPSNATTAMATPDTSSSTRMSKALPAPATDVVSQ
ncbi:hypothetical protein KY49_3293 [Burkholderia sp. MSHR3999]|uniref:hypothetical protein n=1 Tax=Burkholderia sp. MSHR3999 TaxID=1542965 RepID=UPI0005B6AC1C|nr:hypothetical protein [Burkholderia sp. MSHR3999]KIP18510.1 hypothetical protein KY49_3293 [Burkholderia sp. MSHR3999]